MNVQFYASKADFLELLHFVWENFSGRFVEDYSEDDRDLRWFEDFESLASCLDGPSKGTKSVAFCVDEALHLVKSECIKLDPSTGHAFRYHASGLGLVYFQYSNIEQPYRWPSDPEKYAYYCAWPFSDSRVAVNSFKRAKKWENGESYRPAVDEWPWPEIERAWRKIERHLRKSFVGRAPTGFGMLPGAAAVIAAGPVWDDAA